MRFAVVAVLVAVAPSAAPAHKMEIVATVSPAEVRVVVGYDDESPTEGAKVALADAAGTVVAEGTTDDKGVCVLPRPKAGAYTITADDGAGHRARAPLTIPDDQTAVEAKTESRNRWAMTAVGLAVIGGGTGVAWWLRRRREVTRAP